jgi:hypothetical protein
MPPHHLRVIAKPLWTIGFLRLFVTGREPPPLAAQESAG